MPYVQRQISNLAEKYDQDLVMNGHVWAGVGHTFWSQLLNTAREDPEEDIDQIPIRFRSDSEFLVRSRKLLLFGAPRQLGVCIRFKASNRTRRSEPTRRDSILPSSRS